MYAIIYVFIAISFIFHYFCKCNNNYNKYGKNNEQSKEQTLP